MFAGLYPGDHNIIANQFADENSPDKKYFDKNNEETTGHLKWWHNNEPIWATANKNHKNFSTFLWSRCDVAYHDRHTIEPTFCENLYRKDESKTLSLNLEMATIHFQQGNTQAAMVSIFFSSFEFSCFSIQQYFLLLMVSKSRKNFFMSSNTPKNRLFFFINVYTRL